MGTSASAGDFNSAYRNLVKKMATDPSISASGLISTDELKQLERFNNLNQKQFLAKQELFMKLKEDKIYKQLMEKQDKDIEDCTFAPMSYTT